MSKNHIEIAGIFKPLFTKEWDNHRVLSFYGGRGGGKSYALTYYAILKLLQEANTYFYIVRETSNSKRDSIYSLFVRLLREQELDCYVEKKNNDRIIFKNGSQAVFKGVSKQTIDAMRSIDFVKYFWFEEAHKINEEVMQVLIPSIRVENSQIFLSFNPQKSDSYIYTQYVKNADNDYCRAVKVNYYDNPKFPNVMERDRQKDFNSLPRDLYLHKWEGEPSDYNDLQVIDITKLKYFDDTDKSADRYYSQLYISCDTAYSVKEHADYSVLSLIGFDKVTAKYHFLRMMRGQWDFNNLVANLKSLYFYAVETYNSNCDVFIENKASGQSLIQEIARMTNLPIYPILPKGDKAQRLVLCLNSIYENLLLPSDRENPLNQWVMEVLSEFKEFRMDMKHKHDDIIDTITQLFNYLNDVVDYTKIS